MALLKVILFACDTETQSINKDSSSIPVEAAGFNEDPEAREDSIELVLAYQQMNQIEPEVFAVAETDPVLSLEGEDAADDPAFWYNVNNPDSSLIFGSNKKGGIYSYRLDGSQVDYYTVGDINNIDVRQDVLVGKQRIDLLGGSNRTDNSVVLFEIGSQGKLSPILRENYRFDRDDIDEVYGFCLYQKKDQGCLVVNGKGGAIKVFKIIKEAGDVQLKPYLSWQLSTQPEGMAVDDENNILYIGEENNGIWKVALEPKAKPALIPSSQNINNERIIYDIEGLALYKDPSGDPAKGFLLASIQGSFSYAIFERTGDNRYITSFKIAAHDRVDAAEETDGLEIFSGPLNGPFSQGLLVVQDGFNFDGQQMINQNFKIVPLSQVLELLNTSAQLP